MKTRPVVVLQSVQSGAEFLLSHMFTAKKIWTNYDLAAVLSYYVNLQWDVNSKWINVKHIVGCIGLISVHMHVYLSQPLELFSFFAAWRDAFCLGMSFELSIAVFDIFFPAAKAFCFGTACFPDPRIHVSQGALAVQSDFSSLGWLRWMWMLRCTGVHLFWQLLFLTAVHLEKGENVFNGNQ